VAAGRCSRARRSKEKRAGRLLPSPGYGPPGFSSAAQGCANSLCSISEYRYILKTSANSFKGHVGCQIEPVVNQRLNPLAEDMKGWGEPPTRLQDAKKIKADVMSITTLPRLGDL